MGAGGYEGGPQDILLSQEDLPLPTTVLGVSETTFFKTDIGLLVPDATPTTVVSQAFVGSSFERLTIIRFSGTARAKWTLELNGAEIEEFRTEARNGKWSWIGSAFLLSALDVLTVKVEHFRTGSFEDFRSTIYGYA